MLTKWQHIKQSVFLKNKQSVLQSVFPFPQYIMESIRANHSHPGMILLPGRLANSGDMFQLLQVGRCYQHLVDRRQACCPTRHRTILYNTSSPKKSAVSRLRDSEWNNVHNVCNATLATYQLLNKCKTNHFREKKISRNRNMNLVDPNCLWSLSQISSHKVVRKWGGSQWRSGFISTNSFETKK